jgi:hypothetical protein
MVSARKWHNLPPETFMFCEESPKNELIVVARGDEDCSKMWDQLNTTFGPRANIHKGLKKW